MRDHILEEIRRRKIITIVRGVYGEQAEKLARALAEGGIGIMEVTFDSRNAAMHKETLDAILGIRNALGEAMIVGAGTVLSPGLVERVCHAGGQFIVSPDTNPLVIQRTVEMGMVSLPGALTPSEVVAAHESGADFVKLFPAAQLGAEYVKAIRAPLNHIPLVAVGGVDENNVRAFLEAGCAGVGVGGNLVNKRWIENAEYERITALAREYCDLIAQVVN